MSLARKHRRASLVRARGLVAAALAARWLGGCFGAPFQTNSFIASEGALSRPIAGLQATAPPATLVVDSRAEALDPEVADERATGLGARAMPAAARRSLRAMLADAGCTPTRSAIGATLRAVVDDRGLVESVTLRGADDGLAGCARRALLGHALREVTPEQAVYVTRPFERAEPVLARRDAEVQPAVTGFFATQGAALAACRDAVGPEAPGALDVSLHLTLSGGRVAHAATASVGEPQRALGRCAARLTAGWSPGAAAPAGEIAFAQVTVRVPPAERAFAHPRAEASPLRLERAAVAALPSGLRLAMVPVRGVSRVAVRLRVAAGESDDPPGRAGLAHLTEHLVMRATRGPEGSVIDSLDALAVTWNARTLPTFTEFEVDASSDQLGAVLRALAPLLARPLDALDAATLATEQGVVRAELHERVTESELGGVPFRVSRSLFPDGHRERSSEPSLPELAAATLDDARGFARRWYRPGFAWLSLAGDLDVARARTLVDEATRELSPGDAADPREPPALPTLASAPALDVPLRVPRDQLVVLWLLPGAASPEGAAHRVMARWLDARLRAAVEGDGSDRAGAAMRPGASVSRLEVHAEVGSSTTMPALAARVFQAMPRARAEGVTPAELAVWRDLELRELARDARDPGYLAEWLPVAHDVDDPAGLRAREAALRALTPEAVLAAYDRWVASAHGRTLYVRAQR